MKKTMTSNLPKMACVLLTGLASSAFAADGLSVSGDVHGASAFQYRGYEFSEGHATVGASIKAAHATGLYGAATTDVVELAGTRRRQAMSALTMGYDFSPRPDITLGGGVTRTVISGRDWVASLAGLSFSELFVGAEYQGFYAKLSTVVSSARMARPGHMSGDTYGEFGYTYNIGKFAVGGDVGYSWQDSSSSGIVSNRLTVAQVRAAYAVTDRVDVTLTYQAAGKDFYGERATATDNAVLKVSYKF